jgi:hypothetical protein
MVFEYTFSTKAVINRMELSLEMLAAKEANFSAVLPIFKNKMVCFMQIVIYF